MPTYDSDVLAHGSKTYALSTLEQWAQHNRNVLKGTIIGTTDENTSQTINSIVKVNQTSCHDFKDSTDQLKQRARHINFWKTELEKAITDINAEINILEKQRQQLKNAMDIINVPQYITEECLTLRSNRMESDLIHDEPQNALFNEANLIENIKSIQNNLLRDIEKQMRINLAAKEALESDWSDKLIAFNYESTNIATVTQSENVKESPGATKLVDGQSDVESWEQKTINILKQFKNAIEASKELRTKVDATLINSSRDLRTQDIYVCKVLHERIAQTEKVRVDLENQLKIVLQKIVETENIIDTLRDEISRLFQRIQVAQSRLNVKSNRPYVENCREGSFYSLIEEVRDLNSSMTLMQQRLLKTEQLRAELIQERSLIENEITVKKKTLHIDNERCVFLRSHFESAEKLCGY